MDSHETMDAGEPGSTPLSTTAQVRRDEMLGELLSHMRGRRRRRQATRAGSALALLAATGLWLTFRSAQTSTPPAPGRLSGHEGPIAVNPKVTPIDLMTQPSTVRAVIVQTDPTSDQRLRFVVDQPGPVRTIGDEQLMDALVEAGRPAGLVRIGARVTIVDPPAGGASTPAPPKTQGRLDSPQPSAIRPGRAAV